MNRKSLTQKFPFLLPIRKAQRKSFFYTGMLLDKNKYSKELSEARLNYLVFEAKSFLYNDKTGFDMKFQENKVFNLKLAIETIEGLIIRPGEVFSFWKLVRHAEKVIKYKDGLVLQEGKLITEAGGGLCQLSNLLYWMFLHSPLDTVERHPHRIKMFPPADPEELHGVDATISEGWLDLKVKNNTQHTYQIEFSIEGSYMIGRLLSDKKPELSYKIKNVDKKYIEAQGDTYEEVTVIKEEYDIYTGLLSKKTKLNTDKVKIGYDIHTACKEAI